MLTCRCIASHGTNVCCVFCLLKRVSDSNNLAYLLEVVQYRPSYSEYANSKHILSKNNFLLNYKSLRCRFTAIYLFLMYFNKVMLRTEHVYTPRNIRFSIIVDKANSLDLKIRPRCAASIGLKVFKK